MSKTYMRLKSLLLSTCLCSAIVLPVHAAETYPTLAERYATANAYLNGQTSELVTDLDMQAHFVNGDKSVLFRKGAKDQAAIYVMDTTNGQVQQIATEAELKAKLPTTTEPVRIGLGNYDPATQTLSFSASGRNWTYVTGTATLTVVEIRPQEEPASVSPDGRYKVVHTDYNLTLVEIATGKSVPLTTNGDYDHRYGMNYPMFGDMAAQGTATPPMPVSVQWSPDSKQLLTYRLDRNGSYIWHGVQPNPPHSQFPRSYDFVYPTAGAQFVPQFVPIVINAELALKDGHAPVKELAVPSLSMLWPGDPDLGWDGQHVLYQWTKRGYGEVNEYEIDPVSNTVTTRVHEAIKPLVTVTSTAIRPAPELKGDLVISERSGWAQLYYVAKGSDPAGGKALTKGAWEVSQIERVDEKGFVLISGIGREAGVNPYFSSLYKVGLDASIRNLTPEPLNHVVTLADSGTVFIDAMSSPTTPTRTLLRSADDGHIIAELGHADPAALLASGFTPPEPFQTLADDGKTPLYGMIFRPKNFDPSRSYPVIEYVYTGPTTHVIDQTYSRNIRNPAEGMAQLGAIVVEIDARGSSQRGQAFRLPAYQNLGEVGLDDHIWVLKAMKAKYSYFDLDRVGVFGHSAGGYDAARFILRRPNFYKVAVANSGNQDERLDKAWWPEVTMGIADDATWEKNSNVSVAGNLKGHLMLTHGDLDDNVPIAATLRLDAALTAANKPHELVIFPNRTHNTVGPYYWRKHLDFFAQHLLGETPPAP